MLLTETKKLAAVARVANIKTFCYIADFSITFFLYLSKTMTFSHSIPKQPARTLEFQYFYSVLQMNFCEPRQKREERPFSAGSSRARAGPWQCVLVKHFAKFPDFFEKQCWQPWLSQADIPVRHNF